MKINFLPLCLLLLAVSSFPAYGQKSLGIGVLPTTAGAGDETENIIHQIVSRMTGIDRVWAPISDGEDLFNRLIETKASGNKVNFLVIGGHGSQSAPHIALAQADIGPEDVDLPKLRKDVAWYSQYLLQNPNAPNRNQACHTWQESRKRIQYLESVSEVMEPKTTVLLINCSAAATTEGQKFVMNLGEVLLGKHGGIIMASTTDVDVGDSLRGRVHANIFTGPVVIVGDYFFAGKYVGFPIPARSEIKPNNGVRFGTLRVKALSNDQSLGGVKITVLENGRAVTGGLTPMSPQSPWLEMRVPSVHVGAADSLNGEIDPRKLIHYVIKAERTGFGSASQDISVYPDDEMGANCDRRPPTEVAMSLRSISIENRTMRFDNPMYGGMLLDWCVTYLKPCGEPAANAFCKWKGFDHADSFEKRHVGLSAPTKVIGDESVCRADFCDAFSYILCAGGK